MHKVAKIPAASQPLYNGVIENEICILCGILFVHVLDEFHYLRKCEHFLVLRNRLFPSLQGKNPNIIVVGKIKNQKGHASLKAIVNFYLNVLHFL
jgi:ABC-type enterochelin transport system permease subunit